MGYTSAIHQLLGEEQVPDHEIANLGIWAHPTRMEGRYMTGLATQAVRAIAGDTRHNEREQYFVLRYIASSSFSLLFGTTFLFKYVLTKIYIYLFEGAEDAKTRLCF